MEPSNSGGNNKELPNNEYDIEAENYLNYDISDDDDPVVENIDNDELGEQEDVDEDNDRLLRLGAERPDEDLSDGMSTNSSSSSSTVTNYGAGVSNAYVGSVLRREVLFNDTSDEESNEENDEENEENDEENNENDDDSQYNNHYKNAESATKKRPLGNGDNQNSAKRLCVAEPSRTMHCGLIDISCVADGPSQAVHVDIQCVLEPKALKNTKKKRSRDGDEELLSIVASTFGIQADKQRYLLDILRASRSLRYYNRNSSSQSDDVVYDGEPPFQISIYVGNSSDDEDIDIRVKDLSTRLANRPAIIPNWLESFLNMSKDAQNDILHNLLNYCASVQLSQIILTIKPNFKRDFISFLPKEVALILLTYLEAEDLSKAALICRKWRMLSNDNLLWKEKCRSIGIYRTMRTPRYLLTDSPWKSTYKKHFLIDNNWIKKSTNNPVVMIGHDNHVITCLEFKDNFVLTGSDDCTLKMWSACSGRMLHDMVGHSGGVWSAQMAGNRVVSGSTDRSLRVWDRETGECLSILLGHSSTVRCLQMYEDKVVSGSRDATVRIWSLRNGSCIRVLRGHSAAVRCIQYDGIYLVSGSYDHCVKVWNPLNGNCIHTLAGHTNKIYSLLFDGKNVVSGSLDTSIKVWDVKTGALKQTLLGHLSLTSGMELRNDILISGNADSTIKLWNIHNGRCIRTLGGPNQHQSAVTCLQTTNRFIISSSDDGTVKLWDMRTGNFIRNLVELENGGAGAVVWRIRASGTRLVCAVGSRNLVQDTQVLSYGFNIPGTCIFCNE